ncbi:MAG: hypothetical protein RMJ56_00410 [Gemmataceae bacterium]|nr:hypothetical protein [Gemmata sp.]MDW8196042.1 hypothetical protein [Gemmataceae bacterium]
MSQAASPALRALLSHVIDYAGTFPPARLPCRQTIDNYGRYRAGPHAWMLRWLVVSASDLGNVPAEYDGLLSVLADSDQPRAAAIESKRPLAARKPVYCEVPQEQLDEVKARGCLAKLRTGGIQPDAIPSVAVVADFLRACAQRQLAFKATAGLHHPLRGEYALTYADDSPRAVMHGFLNLFLAAAFLWHGKNAIEPLLEETDPAAFRFDDSAHWRDWSLDAAQIEAARRHFAHAFGSCSFEEPVHDLQTWGLLS